VASSIGLNSEFQSLEIEAGFAYVYINDFYSTSPDKRGVMVYDIDPPGSVYRVNRIDVYPPHMHMVASGDYLYISTYGEFKVYDVSDPGSIFLTDSIEIVIGYSDFVIDGAYAYFRNRDCLGVISLVDPLNIYLMQSWPDFPGGEYSEYWPVLDTFDGLIYISHRNGINIIQGITASSPVPVWLGSIDTPADGYPYNHFSAGSNILLVSNAYKGLSVIDTSDPGSPFLTQEILTINDPVAVVVDSDYLYVLEDMQFNILDIGDPEAPEFIWSTDLATYKASALVVDGGFAYITIESEPDRLLIFDITTPYTTSLVNEVEIPNIDLASPMELKDLEVYEGYAYVAAWRHGFKVIDVDPVESAHVIRPDEHLGGYHTVEVAVNGRYAFFGEQWDLSIVVYNMDDPESLVEEYTLFMHAYPAMLEFLGDYLYVACHGNSSNYLKVFDTTNSGEPMLVVDTYAWGWSTELVTFAGYSYIINGEGFLVYDTTLPDNPVFINRFWSPGTSIDMALHENYAYVVDDPYGLLVYKLW
jgi:hypothetical protein